MRAVVDIELVKEKILLKLLQAPQAEGLDDASIAQMLGIAIAHVSAARKASASG